MLETAVKKATEPFGIDIIGILAIVEAIMALFENCPERRNMAKRLKNPGFLDKARLRRVLRKQFDLDDCCTPLRRRAGEIAEALETTVAGLSDTECEQCVDEALGV